MEFSQGDIVFTPDGKGTVNFVRLQAPDYSKTAAVSVLLDSKKNNSGYRGTIYPSAEVYKGQFKPFVILRSKQTGEQFFSNNIEGVNPSKLADGTTCYQILGYTDTVEEAQLFLYGRASK